MPFQRPTLTDLRQQAAADIASELPGGDGLLRFSNLMVISNVLSGFANLQYGYLDWISQQAVPWTAGGEFLEGWAALKGIFREAATKASGTATFTGINGTVLPTGSLITRSDGETFITTDDGTVASGTVTVPATDQVAGAQGNTLATTALTLGTAVAGINSNGVAATNFIGGADTEDDDSLRVRMLQTYQNPPQGGSQADYVTWALEVNGVTRAWCFPNWQGNGTVGVLFMMDVTEAAFNGFPQGTNGVATDETRDIVATGDQLAVANHIFPLQPVTALVYAVAPTAHSINFTISNLDPNTLAMKTSIEEAIIACFLRVGSPGGTVPLAAIEASIVAIPGLIDFIITVPAGDVTNGAGQLPVLGTITWV